MAATTRKRRTAAPTKCTTCAGDGWVTETHRAGRGKKSRPVGDIEVLCPICLGTGTAPE